MSTESPFLSLRLKAAFDLHKKSEAMSHWDRRVRSIMTDHFDFIWRSLRRLGVEPAEVDDATQEVFWTFAKRVDGIAQGSEKSFLFGTALRVASTRRRGVSRRREEVESAFDALPTTLLNPEEESSLRQARLILQEILLSMSVELRTAFMLFEMEEWTVPEIAEMLGIPIGTVNSRLRRARELFRERTEQLQSRASSGGSSGDGSSGDGSSGDGSSGDEER